jgi:hypothetical protein
MLAPPSPSAFPNSCFPRLFSVLSALSVLRKTSANPPTVSLVPSSPLPSLSARAQTVQNCANREQITPSVSVHYKLPIQQPLSFDTLTNAPGVPSSSILSVASCIRRNRRNPFPPMRLLHNLRTPRGRGLAPGPLPIFFAPLPSLMQREMFNHCRRWGAEEQGRISWGEER